MLQIADFTIERHYYHTNMNILVIHVDITQSNENTNSKIQRKKVNFINRLIYAEQKNFCICFDVYKTYDGNDNDEIYEVISTLKNKKR